MYACSAKDDRSIVMCRRCISMSRVAVLVGLFRLEDLIFNITQISCHVNAKSTISIIDLKIKIQF